MVAPADVENGKTYKKKVESIVTIDKHPYLIWTLLYILGVIVLILGISNGIDILSFLIGIVIGIFGILTISMIYVHQFDTLKTDITKKNSRVVSYQLLEEEEE